MPTLAGMPYVLDGGLLASAETCSKRLPSGNSPTPLIAAKFLPPSIYFPSSECLPFKIRVVEVVAAGVLPVKEKDRAVVLAVLAAQVEAESIRMAPEECLVKPTPTPETNLRRSRS